MPLPDWNHNGKRDAFDEKYNENLELNNKYILKGKLSNKGENSVSFFEEVFLYLLWGDRVTNIIKYGIIISGIVAAWVYTMHDAEYMVDRAIAAGALGVVASGFAAFFANMHVKENIDESMLLNLSNNMECMENGLYDAENDKLSSKYKIFNGCHDKGMVDYLQSKVTEIYVSTKEIKNIAFSKENIYGISDFICVPNVRKMHIIKKRKSLLDKYWKGWLGESEIDKVIDVTQMYNDLYMFVVYDIVNTGGEGISKDEKITMAKSILDALGVENKVSLEEHVKNLEDNDDYKEYLSKCFYELDTDESKSAGAFWQILCCKRTYYGDLSRYNVRFLEEFQRFYVELIIFLFDMYLYSENTFESMKNVIVLYYFIRKDIDIRNIDKAKDKKNIVNMLAPIDIDMEKYLSVIEDCGSVIDVV